MFEDNMTPDKWKRRIRGHKCSCVDGDTADGLISTRGQVRPRLFLPLPIHFIHLDGSLWVKWVGADTPPRQIQQMPGPSCDHGPPPTRNTEDARSLLRPPEIQQMLGPSCDHGPPPTRNTADARPLLRPPLTRNTADAQPLLRPRTTSYQKYNRCSAPPATTDQ